MKKIALMMVLLTSVSTMAKNKTICGPSDDRVVSTNPKIGRLLEDRNALGGCTVTMISKSCGISAGHCYSVLGVAEFNTPLSTSTGIGHPQSNDVYDIEKASIKYKNGGPGNDWAVFKIKPNSVTGQFAGEAQGTYQVSFDAPEIGEILRITGYGRDSEPTKDLAQQTHTGSLISVGTATRADDEEEDDWNGRPYSTMGHTVDTMGGNSGSTIIRESDEMIVGIHTHGGCSSWGGENQGTVIAKNPEAVAAIKSCLESDL